MVFSANFLRRLAGLVAENACDAMNCGFGCLKSVSLLDGKGIFRLFEQDIVDDEEEGQVLLSSFGCLD